MGNEENWFVISFYLVLFFNNARFDLNKIDRPNPTYPPHKSRQIDWTQWHPRRSQIRPTKPSCTSFLPAGQLPFFILFNPWHLLFHLVYSPGRIWWRLSYVCVCVDTLNGKWSPVTKSAPTPRRKPLHGTWSTLSSFPPLIGFSIFFSISLNTDVWSNQPPESNISPTLAKRSQSQRGFWMIYFIYLFVDNVRPLTHSIDGMPFSATLAFLICLFVDLFDLFILFFCDCVNTGEYTIQPTVTKETTTSCLSTRKFIGLDQRGSVFLFIYL